MSTDNHVGVHAVFVEPGQVSLTQHQGKDWPGLRYKDGSVCVSLTFHSTADLKATLSRLLAEASQEEARTELTAAIVVAATPGEASK